jgi:hypothetical protein
MRTQIPPSVANAATVASLVSALLSMPATYAALRAYDVVWRSEPNAAKVVWSPHIAMFWRLGIGVYVAGMVAPLVYLAARRDLARTTRALSASVLVVGALISIQGLLLP